MLFIVQILAARGKIYFRKHIPGGYGSYGSYGRPGLGKITSYSRTPFGGHYTYVNQGPGYSHKWVDIFRNIAVYTAFCQLKACRYRKRTD